MGVQKAADREIGKLWTEGRFFCEPVAFNHFDVDILPAGRLDKRGKHFQLHRIYVHHETLVLNALYFPGRV